MKNFNFKLCIVLFTFSTIFIDAQDIKGITATIDTDNLEGSLNLKAVVKNESQVHQSLNYIFLAVKKDRKKNMSSSQQQNKFTLLPNETRILSEISINVNKEDGLKVYLFIKDEKTMKVIAKDSLEMNTKSFADNISYEKKTDEESMMMKSVVINDTKTRVGDDFYSRLYSLLLVNSIVFNFRVSVTEVRFTGNNTQLQIFADDENILAFMARPDEDYIENAVEQTLEKLIKFNDDRKVEDKGFIY
ncbi:CsgE family curli-type amyloid fiber assembly protein [Chryseobacterium sp. MP_3.2]|uniref:CsgE family curli-type amyloid fiber assembly protein n=1 Tax=Chryseobacterium sp. MP_3.2 TaxID=3071712 RepID=UPI002E06936B|nr:hypothetical protein [Chryseobacterium sp. MP_3.2]